MDHSGLSMEYEYEYALEYNDGLIETRCRSIYDHIFHFYVNNDPLFVSNPPPYPSSAEMKLTCG